MSVGSQPYCVVSLGKCVSAAENRGMIVVVVVLEHHGGRHHIVALAGFGLFD